MTWAGLLIATLGWGFLLSYPLIAPAVPPDAAQAANFHQSAHFLPLLGQNAIVTGMGIAVLGALEAALHLLGKIAAAGTQARQPARFVSPLTSAPAGPVQAAQAAPAQAKAPPPMLMPQRASNDIVTRGALNGRDYVLFRDGSVVVETLLGPRRFGSVTEAQEFIGAN